MPFVKSRVNGLLVAIPNDARNVVHRFAVHGGGNELVFDPITRKDFDASRSAESAPLGLGSNTTAASAPTMPNLAENAVALSIGVIEDEPDGNEPEVQVVIEEAPVAAKPTAKPATKSRTKRPTAKPKPEADSSDIL